MAGNHCVPWTPADERGLCELYWRGVTDEELARTFGRTTGAIRAKRHELGAVRTADQRRPWTTADDDMLDYMWERGMSDAEMAKELGRTESAVKSRRVLRGVVAPKRKA
jgi:acyl-CoA reductase-like NAD-dependent aldehyde dehydrogenase